jgi:hypothetical protein
MLTIGCGHDRQPTYPTRIKVQLPDGRPLAGARVALRSVEGGISAKGVTDTAGIAKIATYEDGDGAVAGLHAAAIGPPAFEGDPDMKRGGPVFASRYARFEASGLEFEVTSDGVNEFDVVLTNR